MSERRGVSARDDDVPEKVAWILVRDDRLLVTRSHGRDRFYLPGGHREPGESDRETLVREIDEELRATIDPGSMVHVGTFEIGAGHPDHGPFRMICYTADHRGELTPSREIAEKAWFRYADRARVSAVDAMAFDALHKAGRLS
ncbi:NUDIX domain-containing protein [Streptomyces asoensis]|uniref:NUDIX hydrolase n=1 Tax=Streptomyces asoensis TaxID=249586 RepID=UPI00370FA092